MTSNNKLLLFLSLLFVIFFSFFYFDLQQYLQLETLQSYQYYLKNKQAQFPVLFPVGFFVFYILFTGIALPGSAILTMATGWIFQLTLGTLIASVASTIGATLSFLLSRYILKNWIKSRFNHTFTTINRQFNKHPLSYLLTCRLVPAFPFFLTNMLMGLTSIRVQPYSMISLVGMFPGTIMFVNAGTQLSKIQSMNDVLSPSLLLSFLLLALLPWLAKLSVRIFKGFQQG